MTDEYESVLLRIRPFLPVELWNEINRIKEPDEQLIEEVRLRRGSPMSVLIGDCERSVGHCPIEEHHLREVLERATQASAHTVLDQVRQGFAVLKGGHRLGICGTVNRKGEGTVSVRYLSSLSLRVARAVKGQAMGLLTQLTENGGFKNTLILGAPGSGKTTLLRALVEGLSDYCGYRIGLADERGEVAAMWRGEAQLPIGIHTDVIDGCPKAEGIMMLLRAMTPQIIAADEITDPGDARAILEAVGCGTTLLTTAHGSSLEDLERRPVYRTLLSERVFQQVVVLKKQGLERSAAVEVLT